MDEIETERKRLQDRLDGAPYNSQYQQELAAYNAQNPAPAPAPAEEA